MYKSLAEALVTVAAKKNSAYNKIKYLPANENACVTRIRGHALGVRWNV
jgi:hypothetical protein